MLRTAAFTHTISPTTSSKEISNIIHNYLTIRGNHNNKPLGSDTKLQTPIAFLTLMAIKETRFKQNTKKFQKLINK